MPIWHQITSFKQIEQMKQTKKLEKISTHRTDIQLHANAYYKMYNFESANGKLFFFSPDADFFLLCFRELLSHFMS